MAPLCYRRHRFPPEIIQHAIWLYLRFTLSFRDVEELLAERGIDVSPRDDLADGPACAVRRRRTRLPIPSCCTFMLHWLKRNAVSLLSARERRWRPERHKARTVLT